MSEIQQLKNIFKNFLFEFNRKIPENNEDFLKLLNEYLIKPCFSVSSFKKQLNKELIQKHMSFIEFLAKEVYDKIIINIKLSDECSGFFGKLGEIELNPAIDEIKHHLEIKIQKDQQKLELERQNRLLQVALNNAEFQKRKEGVAYILNTVNAGIVGGVLGGLSALTLSGTIYFLPIGLPLICFSIGLGSIVRQDDKCLLI